jgi:hypothetical protein
MPDWDTILLIVALAGVAILLGAGAFKTWRDWSDNRRIRRHLGK